MNISRRKTVLTITLVIVLTIAFTVAIVSNFTASISSIPGPSGAQLESRVSSSSAAGEEGVEASGGAVKAVEREPRPVGTARVRLLGVNDFHGNLESPGEVGGRVVGGAAHVGAYLDLYEKEGRRATVRVHAGDMVGASPLASSHFHDEPSVRAMNLMDFDVGVLGNHEFDKGAREMMRLIGGGVHSEDPETSDENFPGADFPYLAANVVERESGESVLPPYEIVERDGVRIGFIGIVTPETPEITAPEIQDSFEFLDLSETVARYTRELNEDGVEVIVVLAHSGGLQENGVATGEIVDETAQMPREVDVVFAGHTHAYVNARVGGKIVVEGRKYGEAISVVDLAVDRASGEILSSSASVISTFNDAISPEPDLLRLVESHAEEVAPLAGRVVGESSGEITGAKTAAGESALGDLIADARREKTGSDFAFVLSGAMRGDLKSGEISYGDLSSVHPGTNTLMTVDLTGEQVRRALESQYDEDGDRTLQISGLRFSQDPSQDYGGRVTSVTLSDGSPLDPAATYTVAAEEFIAKGGNGFTVFEDGENEREFGTELDALAEYIESLPRPFTAPDPSREQRIQRG